MVVIVVVCVRACVHVTLSLGVRVCLGVCMFGKKFMYVCTLFESLLVLLHLHVDPIVIIGLYGWYTYFYLLGGGFVCA
jgi:hypothetical protein